MNIFHICRDSINSNERLNELIQSEQSNNPPYLNITAPISNVPHLNNVDVDLNHPLSQNFDYYSTHDFHSNHNIVEITSHIKSFAALHYNIRSLAAKL